MQQQQVWWWAVFLWVGVSEALNYTGETALLDAAPADPHKRHATTVTFGELGVFDFRGDGRARVALELGAFSSEKDSKSKSQALFDSGMVPASAIPPGLVTTLPSGPSRRGLMTSGLTGRGLVTALGTNESRPVRDTDPIELDHVYLIFARSRAVNNFVARLYGSRRSDDAAAVMLCSNVGGWLESEFVAPISALRRPPSKKSPEEDDEDGAEEGLDAEDESSMVDDGKPKISFISASAPTAGDMPRPTKVAGVQRRDVEPTAGGDIPRRDVEPTARDIPRRDVEPTAAGNGTEEDEPSSVVGNVTVAGNGTEADKPLLGNSTKANDVFLVEYDWEFLVPRGGEYAVVIANCAATTIQFKYNLIMANRWRDGQWTNLPAGWMPVQQVYPAVCFSLWGAAVVVWGVLQVRVARVHKSRPLVAAVLGFVPALRFLSCLADQSRYKLWGSGSYEVTMVVVSTSLVDALADGAHFLVVLALAKGWGVVRARLVGSEKRLVPGLVGFIGVATLYDGATRGGGVLAVSVLQLTALAYAGASLAHTRRVHAVQTLRLVSRNEGMLMAWWHDQDVSEPSTSSSSVPLASPAVALARLGRCGWGAVAKASEGQPQKRNALALMWTAVRKQRILGLVLFLALPVQALDIAVLITSGFAVPPHYAYVGLLLAQVAHWLSFAALCLAVFSGGLELPVVCLPPLPAIAARRSIPLPPPGAAHLSPRPVPPLGRLRLLRSSAPFADPAAGANQRN
ncbi:hypothetical protein GGF46_005247 [Coemansia sp. RSA 552]|nr:hypothetical protein GGF46_005247 [Coemansia sp. RSA 552]